MSAVTAITSSSSAVVMSSSSSVGDSGGQKGSRSASSSGVDLLKRWEQSTSLTDRQMELCSIVEEGVSAPWMAGMGEDMVKDSTEEKRGEGEANQEGEGLNLEADRKYGTDMHGSSEADVLLLKDVKTAEDFRKWHEVIQRQLVEANEEKYLGMIQALRDDKKLVDRLLCSAQDSREHLNSIVNLSCMIRDTTTRFRADCENLVSERKRMGELADALRRRLKYFEELETLSAKFGGRDSISPTHPEFVKLLHRLDECILYASSSTGAVAEADGYVARFLELQRRAFGIIRDYVIQQIRLTSAQVAREMRDEGLPARISRDLELSDASKEYLRFRTVAPRIKSLVSELHARARTEELGGTSGQTTKRQPPHTTRDPTAVTRNAALSSLGDCEESFVDQRRKLIQGSVLAHVKSLGEVHNTVGLARAGSSFILRLCQMEKSLYEHFFPIADTTSEPSALVSLLKSHCSVLYEELRPRILSENDLEKLVYLIEVLRQEFPGEDILRRELPGDCLIGALTRCIADAQERLIFRAEVFIRDEIRGFVPSATNLNYPDIILDPQATRAAVEAASHSSRESGRIAQDQPGKTEKPVTGIYATWYPTVERTLRLLSMLYRCIDRQVFSGIAQEAVSICLHSVSLARMRIAASRRPDAEEHAQLFFIWQMLMLREQISPFDVEFAYTEKEFDFTETRLLLGRVLRGQAPLLTLSQPPRIRQRTIDSKRLLEQSVQTACEAFILKTTRLFLDPILAFLAKCNVLPVPDRIEAGDVDGNSFTSLKQSVGSFAHPSGLRQMWEQVCDAINTELTEAVSRLSIYVTKPTSRSVLLRPIRANFAEAASELISALQTRYTLEEREEIGIDGEAIQKELDSLDEIFGIKVPQS